MKLHGCQRIAHPLSENRPAKRLTTPHFELSIELGYDAGNGGFAFGRHRQPRAQSDATVSRWPAFNRAGSGAERRLQYQRLWPEDSDNWLSRGRPRRGQLSDIDGTRLFEVASSSETLCEQLFEFAPD